MKKMNIIKYIFLYLIINFIFFPMFINAKHMYNPNISYNPETYIICVEEAEKNAKFTIVVRENIKPNDKTKYYLIDEGETDSLGNFSIPLQNNKFTEDIDGIVIININGALYEKEIKLKKNSEKEEVEEVKEIGDMTFSAIKGNKNVVSKLRARLFEGETALSLTEKILKEKNVKYEVRENNIVSIDEITNNENEKWKMYLNDKENKNNLNKVEIKDKDDISWKFENINEEIGSVIFSVKDDRSSIVGKSKVGIFEQETALSLTEKVLKAKNLRYRARLGEIISIDNIDNNKDGEWKFYLNGKSTYDKLDYIRLRDRDEIEWKYEIIKEEKNTNKENKNDKKDEDKDTSKGDKEIIKEDSKPSPIITENNLLDTSNNEPYINGYNDNTFRPQSSATREQVASMIFKVMDKDVINKNRTTQNNFIDVPNYKWSIEYISTLNNMNLINGYKDGTFKPENPITRGEVVTIIARVTDLDGIGGNYFADINDHWAKENINIIASKGWIKGYKDNTFRPNDYITRAELVTVLNNALDRKVVGTPGKLFIDVKPKNWYYEEVIKAAL